MTALPFGPAFTQVDPEHVAAVGPAAAILYARISWRASRTGTWAASRSVLAQETGLSDAMIRTALRVLREREWITSERAAMNDSTQVWRPLSPVVTEMVESTIPRMRNQPSLGMAESTIPSYETEDTNTPVVPDASDDVDQPLLTVVADAPKQQKAKRRATTYPAGYRPTEAHHKLAADLGVDLRVEGPKFADHHTAKGSRFVDWHAALRNWIRRAAEYAGPRPDGPATSRSQHDPIPEVPVDTSAPVVTSW